MCSVGGTGRDEEMIFRKELEFLMNRKLLLDNFSSGGC